MLRSRLLILTATIGIGLALAGCDHVLFTPNTYKDQEQFVRVTDSMGHVYFVTVGSKPVPHPAMTPETLVGCRGHVLLPAVGMTLVLAGKAPPAAGQYLKEERIPPPYRVLRADGEITDEMPSRLNVEVDRSYRIVGLYCG